MDLCAKAMTYDTDDSRDIFLEKINVNSAQRIK